jgi:hypothetical protein
MSLEHPIDWYLGRDLKLPTRADFTTYYVYRKGEVIFKGTSDEYKVNQASVTPGAVLERVVDEEALRAAQVLVYAERKLRNEVYRRDVWAEHGMMGHPKVNAVWELTLAIATRHGIEHENVEELFGDIANLLKD